DRNLAAFSSGEARVLVATDVAARGVHVDDVELVVHVDPPAEHKAYLHRSGRTARAGSTGDVVTVVLPDQRKDLAAIMRKAAIDVTPVKVTADSEHVLALVGEIAPHVPPAPKQTAAPSRPQRNGGGRRSSAPRQGSTQRSGSGQRSSSSGQRSADGQRSSGGQRATGGQRSAGQGAATATGGRRRPQRRTSAAR
ncbi:helicase-related protein, partial [Rhodococcus sp. R1101]|uniref:helicase-related protein n=1 Tax=Rhodococcus sp. R1101 TaxID=1170698 RepID=UPI00037049AC